MFIIGHLRGASTRKVFPIRRKNTGTLKEHTSGMSQGYRVYDTKGIACTQAAEGGGLGAKTGLYLQKGLNTTKEGDSYCIDSNYHKGTSPGNINSGKRIQIIANKYPSNHEKGDIYSKKGICRTLQSGTDEYNVFDNARIRKLTPKECWRLQGFPDWAFKKATEVNSDTQLYKQAGNSVTVNVIEEIAKRLN